MAVREGEDRRVGGGPEKLLTLEEAARRLQLPADDVEALVRTGKLQSFRLGGSLLRVRLWDVEKFLAQRATPAPQPEPQRVTPAPGAQGAPSGVRVRSAWDMLLDFLHFNDFYLVAILIILTLLAIIFTL